MQRESTSGGGSRDGGVKDVQELMERQVHIEMQRRTERQGRNERQRWCKVA